MLPTKEELIDIIKAALKANVRHIGNGFSSTVTIGYDDIPNLAEQIIASLKQQAFNAGQVVDPKEILVAQLEAKIKVYETVIEGAGIKLAMPKKEKK